MRTEAAVLRLPGPDGVDIGHIAPVEYAVAVDRFLTDASIGPASRRVYRISLASWAWPLVGKPHPLGRERRGAIPPIVPLAALDDPRTSPRLAAALAERARYTDARTVNRELSALRSAVGWWQDRHWICGDPTAGLRHVTRPNVGRPVVLPALTEQQLARLFQLSASLREQSLWRVSYESAARVGQILALDADHVDLTCHRALADAAQAGAAGSSGRRPGPGGRDGPDGPAADVTSIHWSCRTSDLLSWLLAGRSRGPVFLTDRRAPTGTAPADVCPLTGRARMSYRRAAEIFADRTRPLDPAGRGWTLHQLRLAGQSRQAAQAA